MPVTTMHIKADWDGAVLPAINNVAYLPAKDSGGTLVILFFSYRGEEMHITMPLGPGGDTTCFHLTVEPTSQYATGKSTGVKYLKKTKSKYFDFKVRDNAVDISETNSVTIVGEEKPVKVTSSKFDVALIRVVEQFMSNFILYMVALGHGTKD